MQRTVLLNPGPVNVSERVRRALLKPDACHRESEYYQMASRIRGKILKVCDLADEHACVLLTGSGTCALEAAVVSCVSDSGRLLVIENGVYGERISKIAQIYGIRTARLSYDWGQMPDLEALENLLARDGGIEMVALIHHETTTGLLNPVTGVAAVARRYGKAMLLDSISALAGEKLDVAGWGLDAVVGTANKCIQGLPGLAFVILKHSLVEKMRLYRRRSVYLDLVNYYDKQENDDTPFTPAVQIGCALEEALDELLEEGVEARIKRYAAAASFLRDAMERMGLEYFIPREHFGNTLTSLRLPQGMPYERLHDTLKKKGFVIYAGQGGLQKRIFRIANMGDIRWEEFERLADCLQEVFLG